MTALGVRNNNAGNLEASPWSQSQPGYSGSDGRFAQFNTPQDGLNALSSLLTNKFNKGLTTPRQIIGSWAPASDGNNVSAYSQYVASKAGVGPDDTLTHAHLPAVAQAIAQYESPGALSGVGTKQMPDPNDQGALASQQVYGQGALQNGGQAPAPSGWQGPGGAGDTLQNVGAWLQAANNPGGAASLLQGLDAKKAMYMPKPMSMGTDPLTGKIKYGLFDPRTGSISPMGTNGQQGSNPAQGQYSPDGSDFTDALQAHRDGKLDIEGLKTAAGPMVSQEAKALVEGTANPSNLGNRNPMLRQGGITLAHILDPNFNENQIPARIAAEKSRISNAPGSFGGTVLAAGAVADHAASYMDNARKLQELQWADGSSNDANWFQNFYKSHSTDTKFKAIVNAMNADADFLSSEGVKAATGGPGSMSDRAQLRSTLDVSKSLPEKQAAAGAVLDLMQGRLLPAVHNHNEAFGRTGTPNERSVESFLPQHVKDSIEKVMSTTQPKQQISTAPTATPAPGNRPPLSSFQR